MSLPSQTLYVSVTLDEAARSIHGDDGGTRGDVLDETAVEGPRREVRVVLAGKSRGGGKGLDPEYQPWYTKSLQQTHATSL